MRKMVFLGLSLVIALSVTGCGKRSKNIECNPRTESINQKYIHKYGLQVNSKEWQNRGQNGKVVSTLKSGVIVSKNYRDGFLEGETTYTFPHSGAVRLVEEYQQGHLTLETENYSTGITKRQVDYVSPEVKRITVWYENGTPQYREEYEDDKLVEGEYFTPHHQVESRVDQGSGRKINRDEYGALISEDKVQYGSVVMRTVMYPNGSPKEIIPFVDRHVTGQKRTFLPGGEPLSVEEWENDRREGISTVFQNGEKIAEVPYFNGQKNGVEERFRDGMFLVEEVTWKNGKKNGPCYRHIEDDTVVEWFSNGRQVSRVEYDRQLKHIIR